MAGQHTFLGIDGNNVLVRVYKANPAPDSEQKVQDAFRTAFLSFRKIMSRHNPTYAAVVFDPPGRNWRHAIYPEYKAGRTPIYEGVRAALPAFQADLTQHLGIQCLEVPGVEGEDVLATLARLWQDRAAVTPALLPFIVASTDKDVTQLLSIGARVHDHFTPTWMDEDWVLRKFGVRPDQVRDALAIAGDTTDGVPGAYGVGPATAAKWLKRYGTIDEIIVNADKLEGVYGARFRENVESVVLSRRLVSLKDDLKLGLSWADLKVRPGAAPVQAREPVAASAPRELPPTETPRTTATAEHEAESPPSKPSVPSAPDRYWGSESQEELSGLVIAAF